MEILKLNFKDDGIIPNSSLPVIVYIAALSKNECSAKDFTSLFEKNNWQNSWTNGVYTYHHYHSIAHEVLGISQGKATLQLGGENGSKVPVSAGDVIILPAGTGHKKVDSSADFEVVGAYPDGMDFDLRIGKESDRPEADRNIEKVPRPQTDPVFGSTGGIIDYWK